MVSKNNKSDKLLVAGTAATQEHYIELFPDYYVIPFGGRLIGRQFKTIVIIGGTFDQREQEYINNHIMTRLAPKGEFVRII